MDFLSFEAFDKESYHNNSILSGYILHVLFHVLLMKWFYHYLV